MKLIFHLKSILLYAIIAHMGECYFSAAPVQSQNLQSSLIRIDSLTSVYHMNQSDFLHSDIHGQAQNSQTELKLCLCDYERHLSEIPQSDGSYYQITFGTGTIAWDGYILQEHISGLGCHFELWAASFGMTVFRAEIVVGQTVVASYDFYTESTTYDKRSAFTIENTISANAGEEIKLLITHISGNTGGILWGDYRAVDSFIIAPKKSARISVSPTEFNMTLDQGDEFTQALVINNIGQGDLTFSVGSEGLTGGNAVYFGGASGYIMIPDSPSLDLTSELTLECWIKMLTPPMWWDILISKNWHESSEPWIVYRLACDIGRWDVIMSLVDDNLAGRWAKSQSHLLKKSQWHHIAGTGSAQSVNLYIDGVLIASTNGTSNIMKSNGYLTIGGSFKAQEASLENSAQGYPGDYIHGFIDEVRVWKKACSQQEIIANMNRELTGTEAGLVGYWKFNETGGSIVYDATSYHNHGTLMNDASFVQSAAPLLHWMTVADRSTISLSPGQSRTIDITFNADNLNVGSIYHANLVISSNDPSNEIFTVPVSLRLTNPTQCLLGDVNDDGSISPGDALCAFRIYLNGGMPPPGECDNECALEAADINCSPNGITPGDALYIFQAYLNGKTPPLDCEPSVLIKK